jgi:NADP-dependent 3-hydroxy acid dehydrogenase YdfG
MNLFGTVYSCKAVAPTMKQQHSGKIITVTQGRLRGRKSRSECEAE